MFRACEKALTVLVAKRDGILLGVEGHAHVGNRVGAVGVEQVERKVIYTEERWMKQIYFSAQLQIYIYTYIYM
jgi:hypothetical protein